MANLYILLDATHADYRRLVNAIHTKVQDNFTPRLKLDGTEAIIQVKDSYVAATVGERGALRALVLGSGDEAWARRQVAGPTWTEELDDES